MKSITEFQIACPSLDDGSKGLKNHISSKQEASVLLEAKWKELHYLVSECEGFFLLMGTLTSCYLKTLCLEVEPQMMCILYAIRICPPKHDEQLIS